MKMIKNPSSTTSKDLRFTNKLKTGLKKSSFKIAGALKNLFGNNKTETNLIETLEEILISADLGVTATNHIINKMKKNYDLNQMPYQQFIEACSTEITQLIKPSEKLLKINSDVKPFSILMVGVNGSGKTSTIGKLTKILKQTRQNISLVAADTFRAAAVKQLEVWGARNDVPIFTGNAGSDPASLVFDAMNTAKSRKDDILIIDTAGRLQNKDTLMDELRKIIRVMKKQDATAPHAILLVIDATVGQNAISQIQGFRDAANITGIILTKLDGTAKGGAVIGLCSKFLLPLYYVGVGEGIDDLQQFKAAEFADSLLGIP
jgi:fused signal recognition particle receptor